MNRPRGMKTLIEWLLTGTMLLLWYGAASAAFEATPPAAPAASVPASASAGRSSVQRPAPPRARAKAAPARTPPAPRAARGEPPSRWLCACVHPRHAADGAVAA